MLKHNYIANNFLTLFYSKSDDTVSKNAKDPSSNYITVSSK